MLFGTCPPAYGFEIGVVYKSKQNRLFLAVDKTLLVTFVNDVIVECTPSVKPSVARSINVEELCDVWRISMDQLDEISEDYFSPIKSNKVKRRLPDKFKDSEPISQDSLNKIWAMHRTHKVGD